MAGQFPANFLGNRSSKRLIQQSHYEKMPVNRQATSGDSGIIRNESGPDSRPTTGAFGPHPPTLEFILYELDRKEMVNSGKAGAQRLKKLRLIPFKVLNNSAVRPVETFTREEIQQPGLGRGTLCRFEQRPEWSCIQQIRVR